MRMRWVVVFVAVGIWWWWPSSRTAVHRPMPQAAVLSNGFAATDGAGRRILTYDPEGTQRAQVSVTLPAGTRVVGLGNGLGVVYRDGKRIVAAAVDDDGAIVGATRFGKNVQQVCAQTASNDHRFGVAWTEADGAVWFVYGPTRPADAQRVELPAAIAGGETGDAVAQPSYCAIAAAGDKTALLWRTGDRAYLVRCGKKCDGLATPIGIDSRRVLLGFGCLRDACVVVTRAPDRSIDATWVASGGKLAWTQPLPGACGDTEVSIAGMKDTIAIAYSTGPEPAVVEATQAGKLTPIWRTAADPNAAPSVVWSNSKLFVVHQRAGELATAIVRR